MNTPAVSIVIPYHNDDATLEACVRSVLTNTDYANWNIIIVDDGSTEGDLSSLRKLERVEVIRRPRGGVAKALNAGFSAAGDRDVVRLHSDVIIETKNWLSTLVEAAYTLPRAGIVGARLVFPDGRIQCDGRNFVTGLGFHPQHKNLKAFTPDGAAGKPHEVDSASGAFAYYKREALAKVGGLDENFAPAWVEDDDFSMAVRLNQYKVYVHPGVRGVHYTRSQPPTFNAYVPGFDAELGHVTGGLKQAGEKLHADYWEKKWGWNPYMPDLGEIRRLYGHTEICWKIGDRLRCKPTSEFPTVDCCLVTWNTLPLLKRTLESIALTDYPRDRVQVYVTDNCSTDGTVPYLEELAKTYPFRLHVLKMTVNTGAPVGLNTAFTAGSGEYVAKLDDDIIVPPNWLKLFTSDFVRRPFAGVVGPKILNDDDRRAIQCGPIRFYPGNFCHEDEEDLGQVDYLARAVHVRGCCNLYRRDVMKACGMLDVRFSPTQYDDVDHHITLIQAGYEILYDGRVSVVHKLNNGLARSTPALISMRANASKMFGKWGNDIFQILESALDFSREGRFLPDDGDSSAWLSRGPDRANYPRKVSAAANNLTLNARLYEQLSGRISEGSPLDKLRQDFMALAQIKQRDGTPREGLDVLLAASNFAPTCVEVLSALSELYHTLGQGEMGRLMARRGLHLSPANARLKALSVQQRDVQQAKEKSTTGASIVLDLVNAIGEKSVQVGTAAPMSQQSVMRVLMVNTFQPRVPGGDRGQMKKIYQYLRKQGVHVDISCTARPDPRGYDVVHMWNTWFPYETVPQLKAIRAQAPDIPIALSPIYWDAREKAWAEQAVPAIFANPNNPKQIESGLQLLATGQLMMNGVARNAAGEPYYAGYETGQKQIFELVDHLMPQSHVEMANLKKRLGIEMPYNLVYNGAEAAVFDAASPDWFTKTYGLKDFVITVGLVEPRKNQLLLLYALRDMNIPVVVVGRHRDSRYYQLCKKFAPRGSIFIEHLAHEELASALKAAKVHALPSWMECAALVNVEAALCGCSLVASDRTSEKEYFGENAYYCDPANVLSIRTAVANAFSRHQIDAPKRARLIEQFRSKYTWQRAAEDTITGFQKAIAVRNRRAAAA